MRRTRNAAGEITKTTPKPLVRAGGKTILEHVIERLKGAGVRSVMINLHHLGDQIEAYLGEHGNFGIDVHYSREQELLDTGGGLLKARDFFSGEQAFFVHNGDIYSEFDLGALLAEHTRRDALATLAVMTRESSRKLLFDQNSKLCGWQNDAAASARAAGVQPARTIIAGAREEELRGYGFTGIQVLNGRIFDFMPHEHAAFSIIETYLNAAQMDGRVYGAVMPDAYWIDIGRPEHLDALRTRLAQRDDPQSQG